MLSGREFCDIFEPFEHAFVFEWKMGYLCGVPRKVVGLKFGVGRAHDYGARWYDAAIGRFTSVDPLASDYSFQSPYAYATNNPVLLRDIMGMGVESTHLDKYGNVLKDVNDGDTGVYVHMNATSESDVDKTYSKSNISAGGVKIGSIGGTIQIGYIYANLLKENKKTAKGMYNPWKFKKLVKNKGDWDLKNNKATIYGLANDGKTKFSFMGKMMESQDVGNHHFGVVASAFGFPLETSLRRAGAAQMAAGTSKPQWQIYKTYEIPGNWKTGGTPRLVKRMQAPYGDDPRDQKWIKAGYQWH